ncbi:WXG100-like domain-containing protein [Sphaerisporangium aureirubrum]|uniref:Outer membrane channel protein CpnT-like N-terminal domain-containing protein n=1 Tax=Sphaerisporangium aureirubrum TaxID=1544736 RepID=A0ABW1NIB9_9ACTN
MSPAPFGAVRNLANRHPVAGVFGVGALTHGAFVTAMLGVEWPDGDPDRLRAAAGIWDELAEKIDDGRVAADGAAVRVWLDNSGPGVAEFRAMWSGMPSGSAGPGAPLGDGFAGYPADVAAYCRRIAEACRAYAGSVDTIRHVLIVLAVQAWANMLYTSMYGWTTAGVGTLVQKQIMERFFQNLARSQLKIFKIGVEKIVQRGFYYTLDSVAYAGIQQVLQAGIYAASGVRRDLEGRDVLSLGTNALQFAQAAGANMAFDAMWDLSKVLRYAPRDSRFGDFLSRLSGSAVYSVVGNLEQDPTANPVPTDWETWLSKLLIHGVRSIKPS